MDISTNAVQSYQRHENLAGWVAGTEQPKAVNDSKADEKLDTDLNVNISDKRTIYQWIAQTYEKNLDTSATISPIAQSLFDYGIIGVDEQRTINRLSGSDGDISILQAVEKSLSSVESYHEKTIMNGLLSVFSTLEAARHNYY
ncbi:MAG: UDP-N-acetylmuramoylalanine-D-glutamate ligase [Reinekea sp.]|jgi:UDP-N-acetylmuramoylalanine-D-glutamate ligase